MVRRTVKRVKYVEPTRAERIEQERQSLFEHATPLTIAPPNRWFTVGESVRYGNLANCVIIEVIGDGQAYIIEADESGRDVVKGTRCIRAAYWCDVFKEYVVGLGNFTKPRLLGHGVTTSFSSLYFMYVHHGLVCNPAYQRGYVWTDVDRTALLDTVYDHLEIGSFLLVRNAGYLHKDDVTPIEYVTLDGRSVSIPRNENYVTEIIDGQQRLTTLIRFMMDQFSYRGYSYSELPMGDRNHLDAFSVQYRLLESESVTEKDLLKLFLMVNRGVAQSEEHLASVRARLGSM